MKHDIRNNIKKSLSLLCASLMLGIFVVMPVAVPVFVHAQNTAPAATTDQPAKRYSQGGFSLVQCDGVADTSKGEVKCNFATLFKQIQFLMNWMFQIGVVLMVGILAYVGVLFMSTDPKKISEAKGIFPKVVEGFIIMLMAWLVVRSVIFWIAKPGFGLEFLNIK